MIAELLHETLLRAVSRDSCVICRVVTSVLYDHMCRLQHDVASEERAAGARTRELCGEHLWYLFDLASPTALVRLVAPELRAAADRTRRNLATQQGAPADLAPSSWAFGRDCSACETVERATRQLVDDLATIMRENAPSSGGAGLCVPHLVTVVHELGPGAPRRVLEQWSSEAEALAARLDAALDEGAVGRRTRLLGFTMPRAGIRRLVGWRTHGGPA